MYGLINGQAINDSAGVDAPPVLVDAQGFSSTAFGTPVMASDVTGAAQGFSSTAFSTPINKLTQPHSSSGGGATFLPATIGSSTFSDYTVISDFGGAVWADYGGGILGGTFAERTGFGYGELELVNLSGAAMSGYYTITANIITAGSAADNKVVIELRGATKTFAMAFYRSNAGTEYVEVYGEPGAVSVTSSQTPFALSSAHTIRFDVTPTQTTVTVDGTVTAVATIAQGITALNSVFISVLSLHIDAITIIDPQATVITSPPNFAISFGTPVHDAPGAASGISSTTFGTPSTPALQTVTATGFVIQGLGRPTSGIFTPVIINRFVYATALSPLVFGQAATGTVVSGEATGNLTPAFGTPSSRAGQEAQALAPAITFGTPAVGIALYTTGFAAAVLGTPNAARIQPAAGTYLAMRWGTAASERSDTFKVRGLYNLARFGRPTAARINAFQAAGSSATQLGAPACHQAYRALHTAPSCRFGKPLKTGQIC